VKSLLFAFFLGTLTRIYLKYSRRTQSWRTSVIEGQALAILVVPAYFLVFGGSLEKTIRSLFLCSVISLMISTLFWLVHEAIRMTLQKGHRGE
jgi:hypothetical protein